MKSKKMIISLAVIIAAGAAAVAVGVVNNKPATETNASGDFNELINSGNAEELKNISIGDTKEDVSKNLGVDPQMSDKVENMQEYDYYERYELADGQVYDMYYKDDQFVSATAFN